MEDDFIVCKRCGEQNQKTNNFCSNCNKKINKSTQRQYSPWLFVIIVLLVAILLFGGIKIVPYFVVVPLNANNIKYVTLTPAPTMTATPTKELTWHEVARFEGNATKTTEKIFINSEQWRINWSTTSGKYGDSNFILFIYNGEGEMEESGANTIGSGSDTSYVYKSGTFYFSIITSQEYTIVIEEGS
jgi:predicted nucleic acid-binding Zn ribbon protein